MGFHQSDWTMKCASVNIVLIGLKDILNFGKMIFQRKKLMHSTFSHQKVKNDQIKLNETVSNED